MFDQYAPFIIGSYAACIAIIGGLALYMIADHRAQKRALSEIEARSPRRGGGA
ncbi:MAG: heme exporter protein CcmD [Salinarimonadaceae bacterium]|nr:MAG: heme exporter protein CcmD [Salinarimonadaceae bacterium]